MQPYPKVVTNDPDVMAGVLQFIVRERVNDVTAFNNLPNVFMGGRKVGKIPSGSADVADTDRLGDFNYDADYLYLLVDDSGAAWRRFTAGSW